MRFAVHHTLSHLQLCILSDTFLSTIPDHVKLSFVHSVHCILWPVNCDYEAVHVAPLATAARKDMQYLGQPVPADWLAKHKSCLPLSSSSRESLSDSSAFSCISSSKSSSKSLGSLASACRPRQLSSFDFEGSGNYNFSSVAPKAWDVEQYEQ